MNETQKCGAVFYRSIKKWPSLILLKGPLGAGKTQFARGFIQSFLKKKTVVTSPSYSLVNAYKVGRKSLYHIDLYRLQSTDDLESVGLWDFFDGPNIILVEWAEKLPALWPQNVSIFEVTIELKSENERAITIQPFLQST